MKLSGATTPSPLVSVNTEWVRSAEPPIVAVVAALITPSEFSEDLRVASFGFSCAAVSRSAFSGAATACATSASRKRANSWLLPEAARVSSHAARTGAPRAPARRQPSRMDWGTSKGG